MKLEGKDLYVDLVANDLNNVYELFFSGKCRTYSHNLESDRHGRLIKFNLVLEKLPD